MYTVPTVTYAFHGWDIPSVTVRTMEIPSETVRTIVNSYNKKMSHPSHGWDVPFVTVFVYGPNRDICIPWMGNTIHDG